MAKLTEQEIAELLPTAPGWSVVVEEGMGRLQKAFAFDDFAEALAFTNRVGDLAEEANHHPRIVTEWGRVTLTWWSHDLGGIVANDFEMAKRVDAL
ncbi:MAG: 4a-hydroxytetrahydrobiopterin dehydratase [Chloroflexi bacterium]|jgi:4a-hydroxytetrahydrobiopterin dehydratase|nr:4a-hydroxytetrahydrobiopterin dehydratase [Chloroflexota bacterium]